MARSYSYFDMVGTIASFKESDKFHPYEETVLKEKWVRKRLKINAICGTNRHMLSLESFTANDGSGKVFAFTKGEGDKKGEKIEIPFKDRLNSPKLKNVAEFSKLVVDLGDRKKRYALQKLVDKINNSEVVTDEELANVGCESNNEVKAAYEEDLKKRKEFISEYDFIDFLKKVVDSEKYKDQLFHITGRIEFSYNSENEVVYTNYIPQKFYAVSADDEKNPIHSTAQFKVLYTDECIDDGAIEDGNVFYRGYVMAYDGMAKKDLPMPITIVQNGASKGDKRTEVLKKKFTANGDEVKELGVEVDIINGSDRLEITPEMLTEEQRELLDLGLVTMEELRKDMGEQVRGERKREYRFKTFIKGYTNGAQPTAWTKEDMVINLGSDNDEELDDLFD